jgi:hypothetical protein
MPITKTAAPMMTRAGRLLMVRRVGNIVSPALRAMPSPAAE